MTPSHRHARHSMLLFAGGLAALSMVIAACGASVVDATPAGGPTTTPTADPPAPVQEQKQEDGGSSSGASGTIEGMDCAAHGADVEVDTTADLPPEVAALRDLLLDAALRCDEQVLADAIEESGQFTFSFGDSDDAIAHWRELNRAGEEPYLRLVQVLGTTPALADGGELWVWPQVHTGRPEHTTDEAWAQLTWLDDVEAAAAQGDGYLDYRVGISVDGEWRFFVAGD